MLGELCGVGKVPLVSEYSDIRLGGVVDGPMAIVRAVYELDAYSNSLFLFCGNRCDR